jgi:hypothetical protein
MSSPLLHEVSNNVNAKQQSQLVLVSSPLRHEVERPLLLLLLPHGSNDVAVAFHDNAVVVACCAFSFPCAYHPIVGSTRAWCHQ